MSTLKTNAILDASGGTTATVNGYTPTASNMAGRNRIINGAMVIDQRNAGASVANNTSGTQYSLDRWKIYGNAASKYTVQQNAGSITPPTGFTNYLGITSSAATTVGAGDIYEFIQVIEGFNVADLAWGTVNAQTITLSFRVYSSLTGTFGGSLQDGDTASRSYPFSYSIPIANTWTTISITIAGDTTGTWLTTNGGGIVLTYGLGVGSTYSGTAGAWAAGNFLSTTGAVSVVGTNGATFYITGVQLEKGSTATDFEYRQYGTELALCQRYYETGFVRLDLYGLTGGTLGTMVMYKATKRATPTVTFTGAGYINGSGIGIDGASDASGYEVRFTVTATGSAATAAQWQAAIEL